MSNNAANVTAGKPRVGGSIYLAAVGTALPTNASSTLSTDSWKCLGYASEDGVTNSNSPESDVVKAWGGDTVLNLQTSKDDTFAFKLIEAMNEDVLKAVYGASNVSSVNDVITVKANSAIADSYSWVIDMVLKNNVLKRFVIPNASITELGDIAYTDSDAVGYEITLTAVPDALGNTHYEYIEGNSADAGYSVTISPGIGGVAFSNVPVAKSGDKVSIAAIPNEGYEFSTWASSDVDITATATDDTTSFTMPAKAVTITATFTEEL